MNSVYLVFSPSLDDQSAPLSNGACVTVPGDNVNFGKGEVSRSGPQQLAPTRCQWSGCRIAPRARLPQSWLKRVMLPGFACDNDAVYSSAATRRVKIQFSEPRSPTTAKKNQKTLHSTAFPASEPLSAEQVLDVTTPSQETPTSRCASPPQLNKSHTTRGRCGGLQR